MKLEEQLRRAIRVHYSVRTGERYVSWYRRYVLWSGKRHPAEMGMREVEGFLTHSEPAGHPGHADVRTTEIYTQLARAMRGEITSPLDDL